MDIDVHQEEKKLDNNNIKFPELQVFIAVKNDRSTAFKSDISVIHPYFALNISMPI